MSEIKQSPQSQATIAEQTHVVEAVKQIPESEKAETLQAMLDRLLEEVKTLPPEQQQAVLANTGKTVLEMGKELVTDPKEKFQQLKQAYDTVKSDAKNIYHLSPERQEEVWKAVLEFATHILRNTSLIPTAVFSEYAQDINRITSEHSNLKVLVASTYPKDYQSLRRSSYNFDNIVRSAKSLCEYATHPLGDETPPPLPILEKTVETSTKRIADNINIVESPKEKINNNLITEKKAKIAELQIKINYLLDKLTKDNKQIHNAYRSQKLIDPVTTESVSYIKDFIDATKKYRKYHGIWSYIKEKALAQGRIQKIGQIFKSESSEADNDKKSWAWAQANIGETVSFTNQFGGTSYEKLTPELIKEVRDSVTNVLFTGLETLDYHDIDHLSGFTGEIQHELNRTLKLQEEIDALLPTINIEGIQFSTSTTTITKKSGENESNAPVNKAEALRVSWNELTRTFSEISSAKIFHKSFFANADQGDIEALIKFTFIGKMSDKKDDLYDLYNGSRESARPEYDRFYSSSIDFKLLGLLVGKKLQQNDRNYLELNAAKNFNSVEYGDYKNQSKVEKIKELATELFDLIQQAKDKKKQEAATVNQS